jgi:DNA-binding MarR family transcriptional regulator
MPLENLLQALNQVMRKSSTEAIMLHQAIADALGLNITDHKCLDIITRYGPLTAGKLTEWTGLTTSGITEVIDRLEKAGHVRRVPDPKDLISSFTSAFNFLISDTNHLRKYRN